MKKLQVMLVYGGESSEHEISIRSARNVYAALDDAKYDVSLCYIDKAGRFWSVPSMDASHIGHPQLFPELGHHQFVAMPGGKVVRPDVIFPVLHGKNGEDGTVQGLFELLHIPYVGPSVLGAAVTMEKDMTKRLVEQAGLTVVPWVTWHTADPKPSYKTIEARLGSTVFVKPSRAGSSVGVSKITDERAYSTALDEAARYDDFVLIEQAVKGTEVQVAILGNDTPSASAPVEISVGAEFHDFKDKYDSASAAKITAPADFDEDLTRQFQREALLAYKAAGGRGMARVDFFLAENGTRYLNEINAIPGFTSMSVYPRAFHAQGMSYSTLIDRLITLALEIKRV